MKKFRDQGAAGALLDEYEKAIRELQALLDQVTEHELLAIADRTTSDADCRSIQTILTHVVGSGHRYVDAMRIAQGETIAYTQNQTHETLSAYRADLDALLAYNEQFLSDYPGLKLEEHAPEKKLKVSWGQLYDPEQLFEHAIVHVLRHRRQTERFLVRLRN